ncbi:unnamed protein product [Auanema sp. JU1783]|nr:unnamed protein product [Auanema sp. JU1783]
MALAIEVSTNVTEFPYEKRYPSTMKLEDFKLKLELIVGAEANKLRLELFDKDGKLVKSLTEDDKTLEELGIKSGMRVHAVDSTGGNEELKDDSMVEKYEMSDEKYSQRTDSVREFKKKMMASQKVQANDSTAKAANDEAVKKVTVGSRCEVRIQGQMERRGEVMFVGPTKFKDGVWVGVKYDEPYGKHDGKVEGVRYFECMDKYGGFARPSSVFCGDFPPLPIDDMEEF